MQQLRRYPESMREFASPDFPPTHQPIHPPTQPSIPPASTWNDVERMALPMHINLFGQNHGAIAQALGTKSANDVEEYCRQLRTGGSGEGKERALESHARIAARLERGEPAVPPSTPISAPHTPEGDTEGHNPYRITPTSGSLHNSDMTDGSSTFSSYARPHRYSFHETPVAKRPRGPRGGRSVPLGERSLASLTSGIADNGRVTR